jgi:hypothetical protein
MDERWTYDAIRWSVFQDMYRARRNILRSNRDWISPTEDVDVAYTDLELDGLPELYQLMTCTIYRTLLTNAGSNEGHEYLANIINNILSRTPLDTLLADVPEDEASELRIDLEILGFIPPGITKPMTVQYVPPE